MIKFATYILRTTATGETMAYPSFSRDTVFPDSEISQIETKRGWGLKPFDDFAGWVFCEELADAQQIYGGLTDDQREEGKV